MALPRSITSLETSVVPLENVSGCNPLRTGRPQGPAAVRQTGDRLMPSPAPRPRSRTSRPPRPALPIPNRPPHPRPVAGRAVARPPRLVDAPAPCRRASSWTWCGSGCARRLEFGVLRRPRRVQPDTPPAIEPLPQDQRFDDPAWQQWPFNLYLPVVPARRSNGCTTPPPACAVSRATTSRSSLSSAASSWTCSPHQLRPGPTPRSSEPPCAQGGANLVRGRDELP